MWHSKGTRSHFQVRFVRLQPTDCRKTFLSYSVHSLHSRLYRSCLSYFCVFRSFAGTAEVDMWNGERKGAQYEALASHKNCRRRHKRKRSSTKNVADCRIALLIHGISLWFCKERPLITRKRFLSISLCSRRQGRMVRGLFHLVPASRHEEGNGSGCFVKHSNILNRLTQEDGSHVSIFVFDCAKNRDRAQLARNAFRRLRTMRHPDLLRYIDGVEVIFCHSSTM